MEGDGDNDHPDNKKLQHEGWNSLTEKKRSCTDVLCVLCIIAMWFVMTIVGFVACGVIQSNDLKAGNPYRLINAIDYRGRICGVSDGVKNKDIGYYFADTSVVCVSSCPSEDNYYSFICRTDAQETDANSNVVNGYSYVSSYDCMFEVASSNVLGRCVIDGTVSAAIAGATAVAQNNSATVPPFTSYPESSGAGLNDGFVTRFLGDVFRYSGYIFGFGLGISTVVAFVYLYFLRLPGILTVLIWGIVLGIEVLLVAGAFSLWSLANTWKDDGEHTSTEANSMLGLSYFVMALAVLYACLILVLGKRINMAVSVVKEAAKALAAMPALILSPVIQMVGLVIFLVPWFIYVLYIASSGDMTTDSTTGVRTFTYDQNSKYAFLYMLFCWFWTSEFLIACGQLVLALAVSAWYFTRDKSTVGNGMVTWAARTLTFYHLGTAAFGSLVIAIILTIRAIIAYIQKKAKKSGNKILEYVMCVLQCCMWCLEKIMRFLNKNAYIQTAIYGYSFCKACRAAFFLVLRNILRVAAVNMVAEFVLFLGKIFVPVVTTFLLYLVLGYSVPSSQLNGMIAPLLFTFILAYFVSKMFSEIFGMAIETILCCFIADEEMFPPEKRFADGGLQTTISKTAQAAASNKVEPSGTAVVAVQEKEKNEALL